MKKIKNKMTNGFLRVAAVAPEHRVADVDFNVEKIIQAINALESKGVEVAVFPELCITGYTCGDLFHNATLLDAASNGLDTIRQVVEKLNIHVIVGLPLRKTDGVANCAALIRGSKVDIVEKSFLPTYNEFYERRWFVARNTDEHEKCFESHGATIGIEICEDLWVPTPPSCFMAMSGAQVIFNLSASDDLIGKHAYLLSLLRQQSARCLCGYVYASAGYGESTTDLVFLPKTIIAENGTILAENNRKDFVDTATHFVISDIDIEALNRDRMHTTSFGDCARRYSNLSSLDEDFMKAEIHYDKDILPEYRAIDPHPFVPTLDQDIDRRCDEITTIQECGLARRLNAVGSSRLVVGISGGLDSTLALLVAVGTMRKIHRPMTDIIGVTMPGFGTTGRTYNNAIKLMKCLGIDIREISIAPAVEQHFKDIGQDIDCHDVTYENSQARERTQILMDLANKENALVLGTGDLSELALGWATYNGDHMSMYAVNSGVPKTLVKYLVRYYSNTSLDKELRDILTDIIETPISPELIPADSKGNIVQKTEDLVGPYELHDFFLYYMLRYGFSPGRVWILAKKAFAGGYDDATIKHWMIVFYKRFFSQQFKRSCLPDGPKVGSVCLSPRGDWRMPSDATSALWLKEVKSL